MAKSRVYQVLRGVCVSITIAAGQVGCSEDRRTDSPMEPAAELRLSEDVEPAQSKPEEEVFGAVFLDAPTGY